MTDITNSGHARLDDHEDRLAAGDERMARIEAAVLENTELTRDMAGTVHEMRELLELGRSGIRVLNFIGKAAVWVGKIAAAGSAIAGLIYAIKAGHTPKG